ncbi:MAG TPA: 50S ribosomal protein L9 [Clostridiaceae bacterium]|nr:50S ribosomal protein L9 [Clostridiaceae bacterium]
MKVILKQDINGLGKKDDTVNVSDGYARNYLLPKGLAVVADATNINIAKAKKEAEINKKARELEKAKALAAKLRDITVVIKAKSGDNGRLFGSITTKDIADKLLSDFNLDIDKKKLVLEEAIKTLGITEVEAKLYPGVTEKFKVKVVQE